MARSLNDVAGAVHLVGAKTAIVGIQPAVAITFVIVSEFESYTDDATVAVAQ